MASDRRRKSELLGAGAAPRSRVAPGEVNMDLTELHTHSFIVKIWLETPPDGAHPATWRGHITHVPSGAARWT